MVESKHLLRTTWGKSVRYKAYPNNEIIIIKISNKYLNFGLNFRVFYLTLRSENVNKFKTHKLKKTHFKIQQKNPLKTVNQQTTNTKTPYQKRKSNTTNIQQQLIFHVTFLIGI